MPPMPQRNIQRFLSDLCQLKPKGIKVKKCSTFKIPTGYGFYVGQMRENILLHSRLHRNLWFSGIRNSKDKYKNLLIFSDVFLQKPVEVRLVLGKNQLCGGKCTSNQKKIKSVNPVYGSDPYYLGRPMCPTHMLYKLLGRPRPPASHANANKHPIKQTNTSTNKQGYVPESSTLMNFPNC